MSEKMKAWVIEEPGGPDVFQLRELPMPEPAASQVLIRVEAFGLNRSEYFTRIGESPSVKFPRVLGIECAGVVESVPGERFAAGQRVFAMMGGMGRQFDGSYAEYTLVPESIVFPIDSTLGWEVLGALPEMLQTCNGSLHIGLEVATGETLLIRGRTSVCPEDGKAAVRFEVAADLTVAAADQMIFGLFSEWPPTGPPAVFTTIAAEDLAFPLEIINNTVTPGSYAAYVCFDAGGDNLMDCGTAPGDTALVIEGGKLIEFAANKVVELSANLSTSAEAAPVVKDPSELGCP